MRKEEKKELIRILLYSVSSLLVGCAVGAVLLMKLRIPVGDQAKTAALTAAEQTGLTGTGITETTAETTAATTTATEPPLDAEAVRVLMQPAEELLRSTFYYSGAEPCETYSEVFGQKVPFTTESVILTYDGAVCMGLDPAAISYAVDNLTKQITVSLPAPAVLSHTLDEQSVRCFDIKDSLFRSTGLNEYRQKLREEKNDICSRMVTEHGFAALTLDRVQDVIRSFLAAPEATRDYQVVFVLPAETGSGGYRQSQAVPAEPELRIN